MRDLVIIGGKLQGLEACYLAKKAGISTVLIDKKTNPIAKRQADDFYQLDITKESKRAVTILKEAKLVLPALENKEALNWLRENSERYGINVAFDFKAYAITSSKKRSDELMTRIGLPVPQYYPYGKPPYVAKPNDESGSKGVIKLKTQMDAEQFILQCKDIENWVIQEYITGKAYSIEVIGKPGAYKTYGITEIHVDKKYDCCKVTMPVELTDFQKQQLADMAVRIAEGIRLEGIMDVEAILSSEGFKLLEIDARLPSQTPITVLHGTGINMLNELIPLFIDKAKLNAKLNRIQYVAYEHFLVDGNGVECFGEGILSRQKPVVIYNDFLESDEVMTDYQKGDLFLIGTFINKAQTERMLENRRRNMMQALYNLSYSLKGENDEDN
jgi:pyrrolysine biosynthesis protein PylC